MLEVCYEDGVLCEDDGAGIIGVVVVPTDEIVMDIRNSVDGECLVGFVQTCACGMSKGFIVRDDAGVDVVGVDGTAYEAYIVAEKMTSEGALDGVLFGVGVVVVGVIADGFEVGCCMGVELLSGVAGSARVVVDGDK